jgi:hypothetical protein
MDHRASHLEVRIVDDPAAFAAAAAPALAADPIGTNIIGSVLEAVLAGGAAPGARWILTERDRDSGRDPGRDPGREPGREVVSVAMHTPPFPVHLPPMPDDAASAIAQALHARGDDPLPGLSGDVRATAAFARRWTALTGAGADLSVSEGIHVLDELVPPVDVPGSVRTASAADLDLVVRWMTDFVAEVHGGLLPHPVDPDGVARRIVAGRFVLWGEGGRACPTPPRTASTPASVTAGCEPPASGPSPLPTSDVITPEPADHGGVVLGRSPGGGTDEARPDRAGRRGATVRERQAPSQSPVP